MSIAAALQERIEVHAERLGGARIAAVNLVVGEWAGIDDDALRFSFELLTAGTAVEGTQLKLRRTPLRVHCAGCYEEFTRSGSDFKCPRCGVVGRVVDDGSELMIESLEVEQ